MGGSSEDRSPELSPIDDSKPNPPSEPPLPYDALLAQLDSLRVSYNDLQSRSLATEETLANLRASNLDLSRSLEEVSSDRDDFRIKIREAELAAKERSYLVSGILSSVHPVRKILEGIGYRICEEKLEGGEEVKSDLKEGLEVIALEMESILKLGIAVESKFYGYDEIRRKEKRELENSIISLTEENRDISSLLRIAVMEKEAVEKSLNRLKVSAEQRKGAILQIAEKGLQKVGFGFVMGVIGGESQPDQLSSSNDCMKSDGSECEAEVVSLASMVEKIIKNLRIEINDLRRALEESRSDCEHLQILVDAQTQKITENEQYIKDLEEREDFLAHNVEELMMDITEAGEEVTRWREACELEVEAGKLAIKERDKEVALLREDLERTKAALDVAENKLQLKEKLASTAMAAQAAAETCLRLADSRSTGLRERIEELTRQLEESLSRRESSGGRHRVRYVCWPWRGFRVAPTVTRSASRGGHRTQKTLPEMEALLRIRI
ncbi:uncharacterized protein At3g49055 [Typha angustifolia]|uniref:uncharacterized protein At3g49055 n=1 Tax=Typha angustifolia TaxID=59011 RepID=UPI003C2F6991